MEKEQEKWFTQLRKGADGEEIIIQLMKERGHQVIDLTHDKNYFEQDIDFIISGYKCELKTDYVINKTNNLFLEKEINYKKGDKRKGYFLTTKAEYLFYFDIKNRELYIYQMDDLKKYVDMNTANIPVRDLKENNKIVSGYCLNKDRVKHQTIKLNK